jgi:hypothetical protein
MNNLIHATQLLKNIKTASQKGEVPGWRWSIAALRSFRNTKQAFDS